MNDISTPWHLRGNWKPMMDEASENALNVTGTIPPDLNGTYIRTGPNPHSGQSPHWFLGDGMVHGIRISNGKAQWYRNRFIQTPDITSPLQNPDMGFGDLARGKGNTHVIKHAGKIMCLEEAHWPWEIDDELNTVGCQNYNGKLATSMTAHPKVCPVTGELLAFSYFSFETPFLNYIRVDANGILVQQEGINIPNMVMMHDFNITENYVIFMDLPLLLDLELLSTGIPFSFKRDAGARLGVMPRNGTNADVRWFEINPCYVFHPVNAYDSGNLITIFVSRQESAFEGGSDNYANVGKLWRWQIDLDTGNVSEVQMDERPGDFGRVNDSKVGQKSKFGYLMSLAGEGNGEEPVYGSQLYKYNLENGNCEEHNLGNNVRGAEPVFAAGGAGEDEGWVLALSHDESSGKSQFNIIDATNFAAAPVAVVEIPQRIPYGAHGSWIPD